MGAREFLKCSISPIFGRLFPRMSRPGSSWTERAGSCKARRPRQRPERGGPDESGSNEPEGVVALGQAVQLFGVVSEDLVEGGGGDVSLRPQVAEGLDLGGGVVVAIVSADHQVVF